MDPTGSLSKRKIFTVSELTANIKRILENQYPMVWISGEISNVRVPSSGHAYLTLKDKQAQIAAVMFRGQLRQLKFELDDGMSLVGLGRISVYEPRGTYQIILEYAEPMGVGALQIAFEQLKQKLRDEGLFSDGHKKALPFLPSRLGVITSPTGAAVRDILNISQRRFPNIRVDIYPVRVQGEEAVGNIVAAIESANRLQRNDVLILARGGGSLEDLAPFNSEPVARSIFSSSIPVISAIGHETDFSISDFVADFRAPTPSAAAELAVPLKAELASRCTELTARIHRLMRIEIQGLRDKVAYYDRRLIHPGRKAQDMRLHVDQLAGRLRRSLAAQTRQQRSRFERIKEGLIHNNPLRRADLYKSKVESYTTKLLQLINIIAIKNKERLKSVQAVMNAVNPMSILNRGYSITRTLPQGEILLDAGDTRPGQALDIHLAHGHVEVVVQKINPSHIEE